MTHRQQLENSIRRQKLNSGSKETLLSYLLPLNNSDIQSIYNTATTNRTKNINFKKLNTSLQTKWLNWYNSMNFTKY